MPATASGAPLDVRKVQEQLTARRLGAKFHYFTEISSTNTHARELAERGAAEGEIVIGETQTHGRGRLGRHWESPSLVNLYLSIILRPKSGAEARAADHFDGGCRLGGDLCSVDCTGADNQVA